MKNARKLRGAAGGALTLALGLSALSVPAAMASPATMARPAAKHAVTYKYTLSRIAWTGSRSVIAATDTHGDLYYFWEAAGSAKWHEQLVAKAKTGLSFSKPAIAWTGATVIIVAQDTAGTLLYFVPGAGGTWRHNEVTSLNGDWRAPAVTGAPGDEALVTAHTATGKLYAFLLTSGSGQVSGSLVTYGISGASSVATCYGGIAGYLGLVAATIGGTLYFWWDNLDLGNWTEETVAQPALGEQFTSASVAASSSSILVTAYNTQGAVDVFVQTIGDSTWQGEQVTGGSAQPYAHPVIAWTGVVGQLGLRSLSYDVITATGPHGQLDYWWAADGSTSWHAETIAKSGKQAAYANPSIAVSAKSVIVTAINSKPGNVIFWHQNFGTTPWPEQLVAKG